MKLCMFPNQSYIKKLRIKKVISVMDILFKRLYNRQSNYGLMREILNLLNLNYENHYGLNTHFKYEAIF